ncbi:cell division protein FtsA [Clostridium tetani]|uniref:cell division protein FtsA n=1 Tax=Clostridium tetani TaxID=1513 RepID=UPI00100A8FB0|nr:cell division FtsA domain-containing protein [Clostridium tetani]RXM69328.1 cell division protein FtsA [Clostridium tetani]
MGEEKNIQDIIFALDIGTRSILGTVGVVKDKKFNIMEEFYLEHKERAMVDGQIHDINLVAQSVREIKLKLEEKLNIKLFQVSIAAAGRFLKTITVKERLEIEGNSEIDKDLIRSLELTAIKTAENEVKKDEGELYCVGYSVINYYLNGYVISNLLGHKGEDIATEIIATFLPRSVVDSIYSVMNKVDLKVISLTLEPIAAIEAIIPQKLRLLNLALVDIGAGTSDIAISSKETISAYGMVSLAGDEITEAIAQNCLVDFNTAEEIKKNIDKCEIIKYIDVLGLENEISSEEVKNIIDPVVNNISEEISKKILELNGGKNPSAVFLVGGGAYTPGIKKYISEKLKLPEQRIAVKGRASIESCVCKDESLDAIGVTVLGIALVSIKNLGHDFIDVILNGNIISLFRSKRHTIMDVIVQGGINPKLLIGKNGKNIRFNLNGISRVAFGTLATNAEVKLDGKIANIDSEINEGQNIDIIFAKDGQDPLPKVKDYIKKLYSIDFYLNDIIYTIQPMALINGEKSSAQEEIKEGDNVDIINIETLGEFKRYIDNENLNYKYYLQGIELADSYLIKEGDRIYKIKDEKINIKELEKNDLKEESIVTEEEKKNTLSIKTEDSSNKEINIKINGQSFSLKGKKEYVFVDIFNYIQMDLTQIHGKLILKLNGEEASYNTKLKDGDIIEARWEN